MQEVVGIETPFNSSGVFYLHMPKNALHSQTFTIKKGQPLLVVPIAFVYRPELLLFRLVFDFVRLRRFREFNRINVFEHNPFGFVFISLKMQLSRTHFEDGS